MILVFFISNPLFLLNLVDIWSKHQLLESEAQSMITMIVEKGNFNTILSISLIESLLFESNQIILHNVSLKEWSVLPNNKIAKIIENNLRDQMLQIVRVNKVDENDCNKGKEDVLHEIMYAPCLIINYRFQERKKNVPTSHDQGLFSP